jgi:hypothetical protein
LKHSHYSLQQILADFRLNQSNVPFLEIMFDFFTVLSNVNYFSLNDANLEQVSAMEEKYELTKFDFYIRFSYNPTAENDKLSCSLGCSRDLFEEATVIQMSRRFQHLFEEVFRTASSDIQMDESMRSINKLSLILPEEFEELQKTVFKRLPNIVNEGSYTSIHI